MVNIVPSCSAHIISLLIFISKFVRNDGSTHSPHSTGEPIAFFLSIIIVLSPFFAVINAAPEPPGPQPTTNTSHLIVFSCFPKILDSVYITKKLQY